MHHSKINIKKFRELTTKFLMMLNRAFHILYIHKRSRNKLISISSIFLKFFSHSSSLRRRRFSWRFYPQRVFFFLTHSAVLSVHIFFYSTERILTIILIPSTKKMSEGQRPKKFQEKHSAVNKVNHLQSPPCNTLSSSLWNHVSLCPFHN